MSPAATAVLDCSINSWTLFTISCWVEFNWRPALLFRLSPAEASNWSTAARWSALLAAAGEPVSCTAGSLVPPLRTTFFFGAQGAAEADAAAELLVAGVCPLAVFGQFPLDAALCRCRFGAGFA